MPSPAKAIVPGLLVLASVSLATCAQAPPDLSAQWLDPADSAQTGFGRPSRAGFADNLPDDRPEISAATGGKAVDAGFLAVTRVTIHAQTLPRAQVPALVNQGALKVAVSYWNARGLQEDWSQGPVRVTWTLHAADTSPELSTNGPALTSGDSVLAVPGSTFRVVYPLPEASRPTSWGILEGAVRLPNGKSFDFREKVVRRSPWLP
jgi:hypothetical protein